MATRRWKRCPYPDWAAHLSLAGHWTDEDGLCWIPEDSVPQPVTWRPPAPGERIGFVFSE